MTDTLSDFLLARLDEQAEIARKAAARRSGNARDVCRWQADGMAVRDDEGHLIVKHSWPHEIAHIVANDPARVLADCAAKRAVIAHVMNWTHDDPDGGGFYSCPLLPGSLRAQDDDWDGVSCYCSLALRQMAIFGALAQPYSGHADFDPSWLLD